MSKSIAVIGLGRFGKKLACTLYDMGSDVMAVDKNPQIVASISDNVTYAIEADVSNPDIVKGIGLREMDVCVVAMGSDLTSSIMAVMIAAIVVLYFLGKRMEKRQAEQQAQIEANKQSCSMLIIDKKRMRLKDSGLPQAVIDKTPKLMRRSKLPVVKYRDKEAERHCHEHQCQQSEESERLILPV